MGHLTGKRSREVTEGLHRPRMPSAPPARPVVPQMYSPHLGSSETYPLKPMVRPSNGHTNKNIDMTGPRRSSKSKSPASASSEKSERVREKDRGVEKERMRSSSSTRSVDLGIEEDLVNMVENFTLIMFILFLLRYHLSCRGNTTVVEYRSCDLITEIGSCSSGCIKKVERGSVCRGFVFFPSLLGCEFQISL